MIPCVCIDDKDKPYVIPNTHWIKNGKLYHVVDIRVLVIQDRILGVELAEIDLKKLKISYHYFKLSRFAFTLEGLVALNQLAIESKELCKLDCIEGIDDIEKLIKEQTVEIGERELI